MRKKIKAGADKWSRKYKKCLCSYDYWYPYVVDHDEYFRYRSTVHFNCDNCGVDYAIIDFYTFKVLYLRRKPPK